MKTKFEIIIERLSPTLKRITHKLNGHFSFFDEDDLYQEALEHLWMALEKDSLNDKTDSYVLQGCYYFLKNYIRKNLDRAKLLSLDNIDEEDGSGLEEMLPSKDPLPIDEADESSLLESIKKTGLTEKEEKVLAHYMEGDTVREIGKKMGISHVMVIKIKNKIRDKSAGVKNVLRFGYQN